MLWDWALGLPREWRFVRSRCLRRRTIATNVSDDATDLEDELDPGQVRLLVLSVGRRDSRKRRLLTDARLATGLLSSCRTCCGRFARTIRSKNVRRFSGYVCL